MRNLKSNECQMNAKMSGKISTMTCKMKSIKVVKMNGKMSWIFGRMLNDPHLWVNLRLKCVCKLLGARVFDTKLLLQAVLFSSCNKQALFCNKHTPFAAQKSVCLIQISACLLQIAHINSSNTHLRVIMHKMAAHRPNCCLSGILGRMLSTKSLERPLERNMCAQKAIQLLLELDCAGQYSAGQ